MKFLATSEVTPTRLDSGWADMWEQYKPGALSTQTVDEGCIFIVVYLLSVCIPASGFFPETDRNSPQPPSISSLRWLFRPCRPQSIRLHRFVALVQLFSARSHRSHPLCHLRIRTKNAHPLQVTPDSTFLFHLFLPKSTPPARLQWASLKLKDHLNYIKSRYYRSQWVWILP